MSVLNLSHNLIIYTFFFSCSQNNDCSRVMIGHPKFQKNKQTLLLYIYIDVSILLLASLFKQVLKLKKKLEKEIRGPQPVFNYKEQRITTKEYISAFTKHQMLTIFMSSKTKFVQSINNFFPFIFLNLSVNPENLIIISGIVKS